MKTVNVDKKTPSVGELLAMAREEPVLLVSEDGSRFLLEDADDFDREVAELGASEKFMRFIEGRSAEKGTTTIEQFVRELHSTR